MELEDWQRPSPEEVVRKAKEDEMYMRGYREGKREVYQHGRGLAIALFMILLWASPIGLLCVYVLGAVLMMYRTASQSQDKGNLVNRLINAAFTGLFWPLILFLDAMKDTLPRQPESK